MTKVEPGSAGDGASAAPPNREQADAVSYFPRLVLELDHSLKQLGVTTETHKDVLEHLERMACLIHESMGGASRNYHSVQHVFDLARPFEGKDPIAVLSAMFHDLVYYHVDGGLSDLQQDILKGIVTYREDESGILAPVFEAGGAAVAEDDPLLCIVTSMFGYTVGQEVTLKNGLNEFFSAVIALRQLEPLLPIPILAQIACCIEATIPFRATKNLTENLYERLSEVNETFSLGLTDQEIILAVQRAALLANADIDNMGTDDLSWFLDNAWSLLPESDKGLRRQNLYSVQQFQVAIFKLYAFYSFLQPNVIFPQFKNVPDHETIAKREANAAYNLNAGRKYVGARLLSISLLSAAVELTGGDAPMALVVGDMANCYGMVPSDGKRKVACNIKNSGKRFKRCTGQSLEPLKYDPDVLHILKQGRRSETVFDVRQSPVAAYFYEIVGDAELESILSEIKVYPMTKDVAWTLLRRLPRTAVLETLQNLKVSAITRVEKIAEITKKLS
eukprot:CAMPEP_0198139720 /NCGR_PEP_ID=MMETSP1443-20131203/2971_1 /TAXON_ID=186043 /ORGANISM="Entomoneis sp., Strain CCMP2396" /LENGTH=503 /DNA_ID=CAMNT_0043801923 /DNA_START=31 /DNA_END=1542 /DNA_ORIENTATION=-